MNVSFYSHKTFLKLIIMFYIYILRLQNLMFTKCWDFYFIFYIRYAYNNINLNGIVVIELSEI